MKTRGSTDRAVDVISRDLARREPAEIVRTLREKADKPIGVPGLGPLGPMSDSCIHLRDAARPLGSDVGPPLDDWRIVLDFLVSAAARRRSSRRGASPGWACEPLTSTGTPARGPRWPARRRRWR